MKPLGLPSARRQRHALGKPSGFMGQQREAIERQSATLCVVASGEVPPHLASPPRERGQTCAGSLSADCLSLAQTEAGSAELTPPVCFAMRSNVPYFDAVAFSGASEADAPFVRLAKSNADETSSFSSALCMSLEPVAGLAAASRPW